MVMLEPAGVAVDVGVGVGGLPLPTQPVVIMPAISVGFNALS